MYDRLTAITAENGFAINEISDLFLPRPPVSTITIEENVVAEEHAASTESTESAALSENIVSPALIAADECTALTVNTEEHVVAERPPPSAETDPVNSEENVVAGGGS